MSYYYKSLNFGKIQIEKLTTSYCTNHSNELLKLINIIPYIHSGVDDLLCQKEDYFKNKWNYSYVIKNSQNKIIGVLIAYFRLAGKKHIFDSLYIHRFAISPEYQNIGIGTVVLKYFINKTFKEIPWLLNITVQTNNDCENNSVIQFYKNNGFKYMYSIPYENKTDLLLLLERKNYACPKILNFEFEELNLKHPRLNVSSDFFDSKNVLPIIYFASTNEKKKEIVKFIFHNYNIDVNFVKSPIELTEPQVEKPELEEERKLVSLPLKSISRFINKNMVPYTIEDTMLFVEFFNRNGNQWELPGLDTKRWLRQMGLDGFLEIMGNTSKRRAKFVSQTGAYVKAKEYCYGRGEVYGTISYKKSEIMQPKYGTYPYFFHLLFIPDGADKTLAEMDMYEYAQYDYMRISIVQLIKNLSDFEPLQRQYTVFDYTEENN